MSALGETKILLRIAFRNLRASRADGDGKKDLVIADHEQRLFIRYNSH